MFKKILHSVFYWATFTIFMMAFLPNAFATENVEHEFTLFQEGAEYVSPIIYDERAFNAVILELSEETEGLLVNFGSRWEEVEVHDDGFGLNTLLFTSPTHRMQFKGSEEIDLKAILLYYEEEEGVGGLPSQLEASSALTARSYSIITRREWGADEGLRIYDPDRYTGSSSGSTKDPCEGMDEKYAGELGLSAVKDYTSDGQLLTWPLQYMKTLRKFVVHHTDSDVRDLNGDNFTDTRDYRAMVRAIYQYHTISRGWGDIGYNYIIDPLGNIYEGRYGGDKVIAAHALCYNNGTMGIAIIGNYEYISIPEPAMNALTWLIGTKAGQYNIDPKGYSSMRGKNLPNVIGHKDVRATSCPGEKLYAALPRIRDKASLIMRSSSFSESNLSLSNLDYNAELTSTLTTPSLGPGARKTITLKFKNTGTKTWDTNTWLHVALNNDPNARVVPAVPDKNFVAADLKESSVAPGKTGTFEVEVEGGFTPGHFAFEVAPVINGRYKISRASVYVTFNVERANYSYEIIAQDFPRGEVFQEQKLTATLDLKNTGNVTWRNYGTNPINLGTSDPQDRHSLFVSENPSRIGYLTDSEVPPGAVGHFVMNLTVPTERTGEMIERFTPVIENVRWLEDKALGFRVIVKIPTHLAKTTKVNRVGDMLPGEKIRFDVEIKNLGDLAWEPDNTNTTLLGRGIDVFTYRIYPQGKIKPGETQKLSFWGQAPYEEGQHSIYLRSRFNLKPIRGAVARYVIYVPKPSLRAQRIGERDSTVVLAPNQEKEITVQFKNTGNSVWRKKGINAVHLGTSSPRDRLSPMYYEKGWYSNFRLAELEEEEIYPGEVGTFKFKVKPGIKGTYEEDYQLVMERVGWMLGATTHITFKVVNASEVQSLTNLLGASILDAEPASTETISYQQSAISSSTEDIRIKISHNEQEATFTVDKSFMVMNESDQVLFNLSAGKEIKVKRVASGFQVTSGPYTKNTQIVRLVPKEPDDVIEIKSMNRPPAWNPDLNDNKFRGVMEMRVIENEVVYINELPLEDYIKGLAEVSNSAPAEKQKVIAILARTYAKFYMSDENRKFPGMPYDGSDDPAIFQRYLGYGVESRSPNFVQAVEKTAGMVVMYNGKLVKTPYFNQSDGRTRSALEVWGWTHTPYLVSVPDPWCEDMELNGHGVGLSGYGATVQAEAGKGYEEIIKYYYTGVQIEEI